jgi:hypothetical protein
VGDALSARNKTQAGRNKTQAGRNKLKAGRNNFQIRRNKIQIINRLFSTGYEETAPFLLFPVFARRPPHGNVRRGPGVREDIARIRIFAKILF